MTKVAFSTNDGFLSWLLRTVTKSQASHSLLIVNLEGRDFAFQEDWNGAVLTPLGTFKKQNRIVASIEVDQLNIGAALDLADTPYDYSGLFGMAWVYLGRWLKRKWKNPLHDPRALFCSEMILTLLQKAGYPGANKLVAADTSPQDLLNFLQGQ